MAGIAMRNIATLYYGKEISPKLHEKMKHIGFRNKKPLYLKKAKKWYKKSLDLEDTENLFEKAVLFDDDNLYAKAKLGRILINKNDINEGLKILKDAAEKGLDMGQTYLGEFYEKEKNYKEAVEFYSKAARQNRGYYSHAAQYRLNELKSKGHVNEDINIEDILEYYRDECKNGYIEVKENFEKIR
ncbi:Sel1 repeat family protein [Rhizophagus clarus]|nr:Sel1 repeat family protein [Rhizophagus clarus]